MSKKNYLSEKQQIGTGCKITPKKIHIKGRTDSYHIWTTWNTWHICWYAYVLYYWCHYVSYHVSV